MEDIFVIDIDDEIQSSHDFSYIVCSDKNTLSNFCISGAPILFAMGFDKDYQSTLQSTNLAQVYTTGYLILKCRK